MLLGELFQVQSHMHSQSLGCYTANTSDLEYLVEHTREAFLLMQDLSGAQLYKNSFLLCEA